MYFKKHIEHLSEIDLPLIIEEITCYEYIIFNELTYDKIYQDFDKQEEIIQDIILEDWGTFEDISKWQQDKMFFINNIYSYIGLLHTNSKWTNEEILTQITYNMNAMLSTFSHYNIKYLDIKKEVSCRH